MEFALMTEPQLGGTYEQLLAAARWAETAGMVSFARSDHYYSSRVPRPEATDALTTLAGLARETRSIRLCVLVTPITFRHPAVIAKAAATLDQMSGGRFDLGVGTGWMDLEHEAFGMPFPDWAERFSRLEEALAYLTAAFGGEHGSFHGVHYRLDAEARPRPSGLRLIVGGSGRVRTPGLAGRYADEYNHFVAPAGEIAPKVDAMRRAAREAGRRPGGVRVSVMGPVYAGRTESEYREHLAHFASSRGISGEEAEQRLSGNGVPVGHPTRLAETFAALEEAGVDRFYLQWLDLGHLDRLDHLFEAISAAV
jgi:alkanesulfonate monooxygenase SsuD/methylene tetrahydromethanopterin reductase-like flavin-dependent oxidoreductase (luciferase family)